MADETTETKEDTKASGGPYYAWNNFVVSRNEWGQVEEKVEVGDEVDAGKLGISDEEFEELISLGAVSEDEYPDIPRDVSPAEYERAKFALEARTAELRLEIQSPRTPVPDTPLPTEAETTESGAPPTETQKEAAAEQAAPAKTTTTTTKPAATKPAS